MKKDEIMMQEIKSGIVKQKDEFLFLLNLLSNSEDTGLLHELVKACGAESSLGIAIGTLISKLKEAHENVIPELDQYIKLINENM